MTRPRGFVANWKPRVKTLELLGDVNEVLKTYAAYLPLALRQIFYVLIGQHGYDKSQRFYGRLGEAVAMARRALIIPMDVIRDDGTTVVAPPSYTDLSDLVNTLRMHVGSSQMDRQHGQPVRLDIAVEAGGMVPQVARIAGHYGIRVMSGGGFNSITEKHSLAMEYANGFAEPDQEIELLHIGDFDLAGRHIFTALAEDITAFCASYRQSIEVTRLAVTKEQIDELGLPDMDGTVQAEAIPPDVLADIVREAIESRFDMEIYRERVANERTEFAELLEALQR